MHNQTWKSRAVYKTNSSLTVSIKMCGTLTIRLWARDFYEVRAEGFIFPDDLHPLHTNGWYENTSSPANEIVAFVLVY